MNREHTNDRVPALFEAAIKRPIADRADFLQDACRGDEALFAEIQSLVAAHEQIGESSDTKTIVQQSFSAGASRSDQSPVHIPRIGRYIITREIGRGAMGIVYEAHDPNIDRRLAIKTIRLDLISDAMDRDLLRERLRHEARSAGTLSHPGIVTIYDSDVDGDTAYVAMEYVSGPTLEHVIATERPPQAVAIEILRQTAAALDYANSAGVVHRDVKPSNILLGPNCTVKIADFGIAKLKGGLKQLTQTGLLGTPRYMSPEQIESSPLDGRSDQFSLAVIAFELITGANPFFAESLEALFHRILSESPPSVGEFGISQSSPIDAVFERALAKKPCDRYRSSTDFVRDLAAALDDRDGRRTCIDSGARKPSRRGAFAAGSIRLLTAAFLATLFVWVFFRISSVTRDQPLTLPESGTVFILLVAVFGGLRYGHRWIRGRLRAIRAQQRG